MKNHQTKMLIDGFVFLEGPRWREGRLWLSDMWDYAVYRLEGDGRWEMMCKVPQRPSGLGFLRDGTPVVASMGDRKLMKIVGSSLVEYADLNGVANGDVNDLVVDSEGRFYVGNFGYDLFGGGEAALSNLVMVDADGSIRIVADELDFPNGTVIKDNGSVLVVAETWSNRLTAFNRLPDGSLSDRRVYADMGERSPDGICIDKEGGIWVSCFNTGEFVRVLEGGEITDRVFCEGKRAVACQLGGDDGHTLFCCTFAGELEDINKRKRAGAVETLRVDVPGVGFSGV
jgi:sugar lactone lactonase YvrE